MAAIDGATNLVPCYVVKSLQLIGRSRTGTKYPHELQWLGLDLGHRISGPVMDARMPCLPLPWASGLPVAIQWQSSVPGT